MIVNNKENAPMRHYTALYATAAPEALSARCGAPFENGAFHVTMLGQPLRAAWPDFSLEPEGEGCPAALLGAGTRILIIRYLLEGAAAPPSGKFLTFRELPWGSVYDKAFQGRCIQRLAFSFGNRLEAFTRAARRLGGVLLDLGDVACELPFLGEVHVRLILRAGDEEFPPTAQFLFSDNAALAFTAEDLAAVGDIVVSALKAVAE